MLKFSWENYLILIMSCILLCSLTGNKKINAEESIMPIKIESIKTERFTMKFFRFGNSASQKKFIIIPGLSLKSVMNFADSVSEAYKNFLPDYEVFLFDIREQLPENYRIQDLAQDLAESLDSLNIKESYILGVSMGGMIAQCLAVSRPDLARKIVLGSTASRIKPESVKFFDYLLTLAHEENINNLTLAFSEKIYTTEFFSKYRDAILDANKNVNDLELERFMILAQAVKNFDIYDELNKIKSQVLVIGAGRDKIFGADYSRETANKIGCDLYIYENYGHAVYDEAPDYKERIMKFFQE